jgi:MFS family permease
VPFKVTSYHRNLFAVIVTMAGATFSYSFSYPLLSLIMERHGFDSTLIGLNTASEALAIFVIAPFAPALLRRFGTSGLMFGAIGLRLVSFLSLPLVPDPIYWFFLRFVMGGAASVMWIVSEAWINEVVPEHTRGRVLAVYTMAVAGGYALGPLALAQTGSEGWLPFVAASAILVGAMLAALAAHGHAPRLDGARSAALPTYFLLAPLAMLCCLVVSGIDIILVTFLPIYGPNLNLNAERALYLLTVLGIGGIVLQYPIGWLADRMDRRALTLIIATILLGGGTALPFVLSRPPLDLVFMFVFGGLIASLYTLGNILMGERFRGGDLAAASTVFAAMWALGALIGPPAGGLALDAAPIYGIPAAMTLMVLPIIPVALVTIMRRARARAIPNPADLP